MSQRRWNIPSKWYLPGDFGLEFEWNSRFEHGNAVLARVWRRSCAIKGKHVGCLAYSDAIAVRCMSRLFWRRRIVAVLS